MGVVGGQLAWSKTNLALVPRCGYGESYGKHGCQQPVAAPGQRCFRHQNRVISKRNDARAEELTRDALVAGGFTVHDSGWPDLLVSGADGVFAVEVKRGKDFVRPNQEAVHRTLEAAGVPVFVAWSVEDAIAAAKKVRELKTKQMEFPF
jgi:hypothetical protein